ncbi:MAG: hypothetical protein NWS20_04230 [Rickettsiaceae bacterium]|nr:hypothetical protein [Rickettsiaceae bacterium]
MNNEKLNPLRELLQMPMRPRALEKTEYDQEVVAQLSKIDFSSLDTHCMKNYVSLHNLCKNLVLIFAGIGLESAEYVSCVVDEHSSLVGDYSHVE